MLFVMGTDNIINPIAMQVHDMYKEGNSDISIVNCQSWSTVPIGRDKDSMRALEDYIVDWIIDIAKQKVQLISWWELCVVYSILT